MLSEVNAATESGRLAGQVFVWVALLAGALKCWSISRRPATNTKCALSLMIVLLSLIVAGSLGVVVKQIGSSPAMAFAGGILGLALLATMVTAIVLAILGLVEFSDNPTSIRRGGHKPSGRWCWWAFSSCSPVWASFEVGSGLMVLDWPPVKVSPAKCSPSTI